MKNNLKELRIKRNLTNKILASRLNFQLDEKILQAYEEGNRMPELADLIVLANFYDVSVDYILRRIDQPQKNSERHNPIQNITFDFLKQHNLLGQKHSIQALYFHLLISADKRGFLSIEKLYQVTNKLGLGFKNVEHLIRLGLISPAERGNFYMIGG